MTKHKAEQRVLSNNEGKNLILSSIITFEGKKPSNRKVVLSTNEQNRLKALAKKDANAFNKEVTQSITSKLALDSQSEKKGLCANAHPKMIQARVAKLLGVESFVAKTNSYLRTKATKKSVKKTTVKK